MADQDVAAVPEPDDATAPPLNYLPASHGRRSRRAVAALVDEATSSLQNYVVLFAALHYLSIADVGRFTLAYTSVILVEILVKSLTLTALSVDFAAADRDSQRRAGGAAAGATVMVGVATLLVVGCAGAVMGGSSGALVAASGLAALALAVQEVWRVYFFTIGAPWRATINDVACLLFTAAVVWVAVDRQWVDSPANLVLLLAIGTGFGFGFGLAQTGIFPAFRRGVGWLRDHGNAGAHVAASRGAAQLAGRLSLAMISAIAGSVALGRIAASRTLVAPVTTVVAAMAAYSLPEAARLRDQEDPGFRRFLILNSIGLASIVVAVGVLMALLPEPAGKLLAGHNFAVAKQLLVPVVLFSMANALQQGARVGLIALHRQALTFRIAVTTGGGMLFATAVGAWLGGATGAAWALAGVQLVQIVTWWTAFTRVAADGAAPETRC